MTINTTLTPERSHHRELMVDGESVSRLSIVDHEMRIGCATVRMGGIGGVHTDKEHRMRGYSRRVMTDSVEYMRENGFDVSLLFGIRNFYHKFGYITALAQHRLTMPIPPVDEGNGQHATRPMTDADIGRIIDLYNEDNRTRTCSVVRRHDRWTHFRKGSRFRVEARAFVVEDAGGDVVGYAGYDDVEDAVNIFEVAATDDAFAELVREFVRMAQAMDADTISIFAPPDHPFIEYCHRHDCHLTTNFRADGDGMLRIINLRSAMEKTLPELEARLQRDVRFASAGPEEPTGLRIATDIGAVVLQVAGASLTVEDGDGAAACELALPQAILTQLLIGYRSLRSVLGDEAVSVSGDCTGLLDALFPSGPGRQPCEPYIWAADHF
ncbi:MAG: GNAT family N-acetyltransferase [Armatimonadota bacterium]